MINDPDIVYWVWLSEVLRAGSPYVEEILSKFETPRQLYEEGKKSDFRNIPFSEYLTNKMRKTSLDSAKKIFEKCQKLGYEIITFKDEKYPSRLRNIYSSPLLLYVSGTIDYIDNFLAISVIGARKCSEYAEASARYFVKKLAQSGAIIISGLAIGIDAIALEEAIDNGARTVAVIGSGLDIDYPLKNIELRKKMEADKRNCIISEYPPGTRPFANNFPVRNRIMSGLSVGVLVVEAGEKSGSLITAKIAIDQGKDVFGIPNNIFFKNNLGTLKLLKDSAQLVTDPNDIINQYRWQYKLNDVNEESFDSTEDLNFDFKLEDMSFLKDENKEKKDTNEKYIEDELEKKEEIGNNLDGNLKEIYQLLKQEGPQNVDFISEKTNISISEILVSLTQLELMGYIKNCPGMKYGII